MNRNSKFATWQQLLAAKNKPQSTELVDVVDPAEIEPAIVLSAIELEPVKPEWSEKVEVTPEPPVEPVAEVVVEQVQIEEIITVDVALENAASPVADLKKIEKKAKKQ